MRVSEASLKQSLVKEMRKQMRGVVVFRHEDRHIFGVPDISCTWGGITSWWEVKVADPAVKITSIQVLTCQKLAKAGSACGIIIYQEMPHCSYIVDPFKIETWATTSPEDLVIFKGFPHLQLVHYIKGVHNAVG